MERTRQAVAAGKCRHAWLELGVSPKNGKRYRRCEKCGTIREETLPYIT